MGWREEPASLKQRSYLVILGFVPPRRLTKGEADALIKTAKERHRRALRVRGLYE